MTLILIVMNANDTDLMVASVKHRLNLESKSRAQRLRRVVAVDGDGDVVSMSDSLSDLSVTSDFPSLVAGEISVGEDLANFLLFQLRLGSRHC